MTKKEQVEKLLKEFMQEDCPDFNECGKGWAIKNARTCYGCGKYKGGPCKEKVEEKDPRYYAGVSNHLNLTGCGY